MGEEKKKEIINKCKLCGKNLTIFCPTKFNVIYCGKCFAENLDKNDFIEKLLIQSANGG